jgi:methyltransferase (TIGR00027 family)
VVYEKGLPLSQTESSSKPEPLIRNISDTARWVAVYRARESDRPDALFRDPYARRLAGERGEQIANSMPFSNKNSWSFVTRTYLFDQFIAEQVAQGVDTVINLAAGLDARPYRMPLPASLRWFEVDLPKILSYKEGILGKERPVCALERIRLDLSDVTARRDLFAQLGGDAGKALIITEGLITYLSEDEVGSFARDLAAPPAFQLWALDIGSPGLLKMLQKNTAATLSAAGSPLKFGPKEGPGFFIRYGWKPMDVRSLIKAASRLKRLSIPLRLIAMLPESNGAQGSRPWSAVCLFAKS